MNNLRFLLSEAAGDAPTGASMFSPLIILALFALMFYFFIYRPQKKQEKVVTSMRDNLKVGDEISTNGGILGKIIQIKDDCIVIENGADRTKIKVAKWAVRAVEVPVETDDDDDEE